MRDSNYYDYNKSLWKVKVKLVKYGIASQKKSECKWVTEGRARWEWLKKHVKAWGCHMMEKCEHAMFWCVVFKVLMHWHSVCTEREWIQCIKTWKPKYILGSRLWWDAHFHHMRLLYCYSTYKWITNPLFKMIW